MLTVVLAAASASRLGLGTYQHTTNYGNSQPLPAEIKPVVDQGLHALNIASASLNSLAPQLPAALQSTNAAMKDNTAKVGKIIGKVCDKILREANPSGRAFHYFTPESLRSTCDYIRKVSDDMIAGINNPAIYVGYIEKMNEGIQKLNAAATNFQYGSNKPKTSFATKTVTPPFVLGGSGFGNAPASANSMFSAELRAMVNQGLDATNKAAEALNSLAPQLPAALKSMDPSTKNDIRKVDNIIGKVCDEILNEANTNNREFQYFTKDSLQATCN